MLKAREEVKKVHLVLCTSDRGLCGGFNSNLISKAELFIKEKKHKTSTFHLRISGRKVATGAVEAGLKLSASILGVVGGRFGFNIAAAAGKKLIDGFLDKAFDEVYIVFAEFISMARQTPVLSQMLPILPIESAQDTSGGQATPYLAEHICEPSAQEVLGELLPRNVYVQLHSAFLETSTSEHAARMAAMDNATKACNDMIGTSL